MSACEPVIIKILKNYKQTKISIVTGSRPQKKRINRYDNSPNNTYGKNNEI